MAAEALLSARRLRRAISPTRLIAGGFALLFMLILAMGRSYPPEARLFPTLVGGVGLLLAAWLVVADADPAHGPRDPSAEAAGAALEPDERRRRLLLGVLSPVVYSFLVWLSGFYPATLSVLLGLPILLGFRALRVLVPVVILLLLVFVGLFSYAMELSLPMGVIGDWALAHFLYRD